MMQGKVDIAFKIKGPTQYSSTNSTLDDAVRGERGQGQQERKEGKTATVYFTSLRPSQQASFDTVRFLIVDDQGNKLSLLE